MLTNEQMLITLRYLKAANLSGPLEEGQAAVWLDALGAKMPHLRIEDVQAACREMVVTRSTAKGNTWITPGDLLDEVRRIRRKRIEVAGTLPEPPVPLGVDGERKWLTKVRDLIGDGLPPERAADVVRRDLGLPEPPPLIDKPTAAVIEAVEKSTRPRSGRSGVSA